jgi:hypothetical protein
MIKCRLKCCHQSHRHEDAQKRNQPHFTLILNLDLEVAKIVLEHPSAS